MSPNEAIKVLQAMQNVAIQKGLFVNVEAVNQVSAALHELTAMVLINEDLKRQSNDR